MRSSTRSACCSLAKCCVRSSGIANWSANSPRCKRQRAAVARHGQHGLRVAPAAHSTQTVQTQRHALLGVPMLAATLAGPAPVAPPAVNPSPEAKVCRRAYAALLPKLTELAAVSRNLARLYAEYRKTVRRVRALQDLLLPEVEQQLAAVETGLEELEQDEAGFLQRAAQAAGR
jgi:V/A-type H+-transporting ATPase subunit D